MSDATASSPKVKIAWLIGILAAFALFALIAAYSSRMTWDYPDYDQQRAADRYDTLVKLQHDEHALITPVDDKGNPTAEWVDQDKQIIRIPIDEAMALELGALKDKPAQIGSAIVVAAPAAPASTNAAPANPKAPSATGATNAAPAAKPPPAKSNK